MQAAGVPRQTNRADRRGWRPPLATLALALSLCAAYALQARVYPAPNSLESLAAGATTGWLVQAGEWFRLATASFAHISLGHFAINTFGITWMSWQGERRFGSTRVVLLALSGALGGALVASALSDSIMLGSSTIGFGLGTGVLVLFIDKRPGSWVGLAVGLVVVLLVHAFAPWRGQISFSGHFGAAVAGAATATLIHPTYGRVGARAQQRIATAVVLAFLALLAWGGVALARWDERAMFAGARALYMRASPPPGLVADLALEAYHSPLATQAQQLEARIALRRVLRGPSRAAYPFAVDGHLREHDGDVGGALRAFHEAFARDPQVQSAHAVARLQDRAGTVLPRTAAVALEPDSAGESQLVVASALGRGCLWHLLGRQGGTTRAVVHLVLGGARRGSVALAVPGKETPGELTWYVGLERCGGIAPEARAVHYWSTGAREGSGRPRLRR